MYAAKTAAAAAAANFHHSPTSTDGSSQGAEARRITSLNFIYIVLKKVNS